MTTKFRNLIAAAIVAAVGACTVPQADTPAAREAAAAADRAKRAALFCHGVTGSLNVLTVRLQAGRLSAEDVDRVDDAVAIATPICTSATPPASDLDALEGAVNALLVIELGGR